MKNIYFNNLISDVEYWFKLCSQFFLFHEIKAFISLNINIFFKLLCAEEQFEKDIHI